MLLNNSNIIRGVRGHRSGRVPLAMESWHRTTYPVVQGRILLQRLSSLYCIHSRILLCTQRKFEPGWIYQL